MIAQHRCDHWWGKLQIPLTEIYYTFIGIIMDGVKRDGILDCIGALNLNAIPEVIADIILEDRVP